MNQMKRRRFASKMLIGSGLAALFFAWGVSLRATDPVPEPTKKQAIKGTNHDHPNALLRIMAGKLHAEAYSEFIRANGNGLNREIRLMPTKKERKWYIPVWTSEELAKEQPPRKGVKDLASIHRLSLDQFAASNAKKANERLASNRLVRNEKKESPWEIKALDLVGLVMHDTPVVYMSATLPDMKDLKKKTTREPDVFESEGLEELATGKDLYIRSQKDTIRVLGPIQAGKACLKCHTSAKEGDLLGAFSYMLRPAEYRLTRRGGQPFNPQFDRLERLIQGASGPNSPTPKK